MKYKGQEFESTKRERLKGSIISTTIFVVLFFVVSGFIWGLALDTKLLIPSIYIGLGISLAFAVFYIFIYKSRYAKDSFFTVARFLGMVLPILFIVSVLGASVTWIVRYFLIK